MSEREAEMIGMDPDKITPEETAVRFLKAISGPKKKKDWRGALPYVQWYWRANHDLRTSGGAVTALQRAFGGIDIVKVVEVGEAEAVQVQGMDASKTFAQVPLKLLVRIGASRKAVETYVLAMCVCESAPGQPAELIDGGIWGVNPVSLLKLYKATTDDDAPYAPIVS